MVNFSFLTKTNRLSIFGRAGAFTLLMLTITLCTSVNAQTMRDPWQHPFAANSIWNTPLGSGATFAPANINNDWGMSNDYERFVMTSPNDPLRTLYYPGSWVDRDSGTEVSWIGQMRVPDNLIIPDAINENGVYSTPNECSTFLQPNGRNFIQLEPTTRTTINGPIWGYPQTDWGESPAEGNLFGRGERGTHYGSGLSAIGGSLRVGELTSPDPIRHALKIELWGKFYYWYSADLPGYKWPARNADGYASTTYGGTDRNLVNGSLLALQWNTSEAELGGLESEPGRKLFQAFKEYGAYIVDDTGWYNNAICADIKVNDELRNRYGYTFDGAKSGPGSNPLSRDLGKIFRALQIVTNNTPTSIGGPGERRVTAPLPQFAYGVRKTIEGNTQIEAEDYNTGEAGAAYGDSDSAQNGGAYRNGAVDIRTGPDQDAGAPGNYQVGWTTSGEWLGYEVNVRAGGEYRFQVRASAGGGGGTLRLEDASGNVLTTVTINGTGNYDVFQTFTSQSFSLAAGEQTLIVKVASGGYDLNWFRFVRTAGEPQRRTPFDFDGDRRADVSVFRPASGIWYRLNSGSNNSFFSAQFGASDDKIVPSDFDSDGKTDLAVFRPSSGIWYLQQSSNGFASAQFGASEDVPAPADFDGDGKADLAVFRPSLGRWYVQSSTQGFYSVQFGQAGDVPQVGDFDGDGKADISLFRPSNGTWYRLNISDNSFAARQFGATGDIPNTADFDADGKTDLAVFRPSNGYWFVQRSTTGFVATQFGLAGDRPAAADYDGDGKADVTVFRPSSGTWFINQTTAGFYTVQFGSSGDVPAESTFRQ